MNKAISMTLIIVGIVLLVMGITAMDSIGSDFSRFFTGTPTDKSVWMFVGGAAALVVGVSGPVLGARKK